MHVVSRVLICRLPDIGFTCYPCLTEVDPFYGYLLLYRFLGVVARKFLSQSQIAFSSPRACKIMG